MKTRLYTPPPGYYDLPFTWAFDASGFTDGTNHPNSSVYLQGGYGDFLLRRVIGMNRFLASNGTGKFQIQRASKGSYIQSDPVQAPNSPELAIAPAELYPETGKIWFDLFGILKPAQPLTSQIAFQGVRRMKGTLPGHPLSKPKSYTYEVAATITQVVSGNSPIVTKTLITDYDFELHQIIVLSPNTLPVCSLVVYDQNKIKISNIPVLDIFYNGAPGSQFENGALVPPLYYRKESILEIDVYSQVTNAGLLPFSITILLVGKKLYPCA